MDDKQGRRHWGQAPWRRGPSYGRAALPRAPEVAIIGGGLTGVSAAYHLARRGVNAALFEADRIGGGASGRTGGIVLEGLSSGPREGARDCVPRLKQLVDELGIDCDLRLPGCWEIVHRARDERSRLPIRDNDSSIEILRTVPGGAAEPGALTAGIAEAAVRAGAVIREHCAVERIGLKPLEIVVDGVEISPGNVIVAVNAWLPAIFPTLRNIHSALTYAVVTEPLSEAALEEIGMGGRIPFYTADTPYLWARVCADRSVVFGAGLSYGDPLGLEAVAMTDAEPAEILARMERRVHQLHPVLSRTAITSGWAGPIAFREGAIPVLMGHPENERVLMAAAIVDGATLPAWGACDLVTNLRK